MTTKRKTTKRRPTPQPAKEAPKAEAGGYTISGCTFNGSPNGDVCAAVLQIAKTLEEAAKSLRGNPSLILGKVN